MGMQFAKLVFKTYRIKKKMQRYKLEKENVIRKAKKLPIKKGPVDKYRQFWFSIRQVIVNFLKKVLFFQAFRPVRRFWGALKTKGTIHNYIWRSFLGFIGGIIMTYICFLFFVFNLNFPIHLATLWCGLLGIILSLGLAFSLKVRCIFFLLLPQLFSSQGRQALIAYAFILVLTGPGKNMLHNGTVLSESLACGQEQIKIAIKQVGEAIKKPFVAIWESFKNVMRKIKEIALKVKGVLIAIKRLVIGIVRVFATVFQWLGSIINFCNKKVGTPFQRCTRVFDNAIIDCKAALGPIFNWLCNIAYLIKTVCYAVKFLDFICMFFSFITNALIGPLKKKIKVFMRHIRNIFYVNVDFHHDYHFATSQNKSFKEIASGILGDIKDKVDRLLAVFDWMSFVTSFFFLFMLVKALNYQHKYMVSDRFDNRYITGEFTNLNMKRAQKNLETLLPLKRRERAKYIQVTSIRLVQVEKTKLTRTSIFLGFATLKLSIHMVADYCLFWVLDLIRFHGRYSTQMEAPGMVGVSVQGSGVLVDLYRSIIKAFKLPDMSTDLNSIPCLPEPLPPDFNRYIQIVILIVLCWILAIGEPYGLRLRQSVMSLYHPDRSRQRTVWLYNHILRSRGGFLKFIRRQLRRKFTKDMGIEKVTLSMRIREMCPLLNILFGSLKIASCMVCARTVRTDKPNEEQLIRCPNPGCPGTYCSKCFQELHNLCTICLEPVEYGDLSDLSEEKDSSDFGPPPLPGNLPFSPSEEIELTSKQVVNTSDTSSSYSYSYQNKPFDSPVTSIINREFRDIEKNQILVPSTLTDLESSGEENLREGTASRMGPKRSVRFRNDGDNPRIWEGIRALGRGVFNFMPLLRGHQQISDDELSSSTYVIEDSRSDSDSDHPLNRTYTKTKKKFSKKRSMFLKNSIQYESDTENDIDSEWSDNNEQDKLIKKPRKKSKLKITTKNNFWYKIKRFFNFFKLLHFKKNKSKDENLIQSSDSNEDRENFPSSSHYDSPNTSNCSPNLDTENEINTSKEKKSNDEENNEVTTLYSRKKFVQSSSQEDNDLNNSDGIDNIFKNSKLEFSKPNE